MFATTKALAFQRSAEHARSFKNTVFEDGGVQYISRIKIYRTTIILKQNIPGGVTLYSVGCEAYGYRNIQPQPRRGEIMNSCCYCSFAPSGLCVCYALT